jgi:formyltetrahydrofolate-dependent phosphoribosylglycinamide formyltransferase
MTGRLVVLASGSGTNLQAILNACETGELPADVVAVICDQKNAYALERAKKHNIPSVYHPWKPYKDAGRTRREYDSDLAEKAATFKPAFIILAGWMRLLTMSFLDNYPMRVINLHPALPGKFPGTHAIQRAFEVYQRGEIDHTGVMVHFVPDEGVDDGPVIAQEIVPILPNDTVSSLEERIHQVEHRLLVDAIRNTILEN